MLHTLIKHDTCGFPKALLECFLARGSFPEALRLLRSTFLVNFGTGFIINVELNLHMALLHLHMNV